MSAQKPEQNQKNSAINTKSPNALREEATLEFWKREHIFEKSVENPAGFGLPGKPAVKGEFVFYDGPPFATGSPHYGHILAGTIKDAIPRYKTMQGYRVRRRWGWDCHGLPVENLIEKELGLKSKKDILTYGVEKFNAASRASVMRYADIWRTLVPRFGRFVDMENDYETMSPTYTESVWWAFKQLYDKGLIYEGFKSMQLCPRCETTLSNFEVSQGYKDITDISVYVKFELTPEGKSPQNSNEKTFLIAWTTTPWTLPGNVALAVGPDIEYVKLKIAGAGADGAEGAAENYIVAKARLEHLKKTLAEKLADKNGDKKIEDLVVETFTGKKLIGRSYTPVFDYYVNDTTVKNRENAWKVYGASFVTTEDGTGVVHIAPAFGADDYELSLTYKLPFIQHVTMDGHFKKEVTDFAGQAVKAKPTPEDKDAHQRADIEIIKYLAHHGTLLAKEKLIHSYAHCWRCETPLLNYATSSWFVKVTAFKDKLVEINKKIRWMPEEIGEGRFGNWLGNARDWAISRSRFWGAPLPVWKDEKTGTCEVIGSLADLKVRTKSKNTYYIVRHGEAENNVKMIVSAVATAPHHLTPKGIEQARASAKLLKDKKIDLMFISPFVRTRETADILIEGADISDKNTFVDDRIREVGAGKFNGLSLKEYHDFFSGDDRFTKAPTDGENFTDIKRRMGEFLYDLETKYSGKNILIVTHDTPAWLLTAAALGLDETATNTLRTESSKQNGTDFFIRNAEVHKLDFTPIPHNRNFELDLHRPFIDEIELTSKAGNRLARVPEVFDCWFESGSMPYGEAHYPFAKREGIDAFDPNVGTLSKLFGGKSRGFPANFIAEGLDQTRGWFYSMLVLGVALFDRSPYEQVIVNGLILAEDGQKMAKSKANFPDPMTVVNKYGADAVRYYMLASPVVRGQDFCFSEKGVDEVVKKHIGRLNNVVTFYEMYVTTPRSVTSKDPLDQWILARTRELVVEVTRAMESYELDRATRPFADFIDDLSTWYIRRSRDRFKGDDRDAVLSTTRTVLMTTAQLLAPFMPFLAEDIYSRMNKVGISEVPESVHLTAWPQPEDFAVASPSIIAHMAEVRRIASLGLEARSKAKINVRQPLATLMIMKKVGRPDLASSPELLTLIKDEVNVKDIVWKDIATEVELDTALTPVLKEEGQVRELIRMIQDLRKKEDLKIEDVVALVITIDPSQTEGKSVIEKNKTEIMKTTGLTSIDIVEGPAPELGFSVSIKR